jgi:hypothetical protein
VLLRPLLRNLRHHPTSACLRVLYLDRRHARSAPRPRQRRHCTFSQIRATRQSTAINCALRRLSFQGDQFLVRLPRAPGDRCVRPRPDRPGGVVECYEAQTSQRHVTCTPARYQSPRPSANNASPRGSAVNHSRANSRTGTRRFSRGIRSKSRAVSSIPHDDPIPHRQFRGERFGLAEGDRPRPVAGGSAPGAARWTSRPRRWTPSAIGIRSWIRSNRLGRMPSHAYSLLRSWRWSSKARTIRHVLAVVSNGLSSAGPVINPVQLVRGPARPHAPHNPLEPSGPRIGSGTARRSRSVPGVCGLHFGRAAPGRIRTCDQRIRRAPLSPSLLHFRRWKSRI